MHGKRIIANAPVSMEAKMTIRADFANWNGLCSSIQKAARMLNPMSVSKKVHLRMLWNAQSLYTCISRAVRWRLRRNISNADVASVSNATHTSAAKAIRM